MKNHLQLETRSLHRLPTSRRIKAGGRDAGVNLCESGPSVPIALLVVMKACTVRLLTTLSADNHNKHSDGWACSSWWHSGLDAGAASCCDLVAHADFVRACDESAVSDMVGVVSGDHHRKQETVECLMFREPSATFRTTQYSRRATTAYPQSL
ncbi:hypothetical protein BDW02DRAFT_174206 [Decorospora gaudefroyi]|uniref:Uncharacterized protein n=1 Tax=Decorospora gaudefroyi TaxID=184978 RepID=A0A6A5KM84_9PLEO|nr:hypothetical protein BDW02DRAFT_174206 [Decorospora gaudefroyi]